MRFLNHKVPPADIQQEALCDLIGMLSGGKARNFCEQRVAWKRSEWTLSSEDKLGRIY